MTAWNKLAGKFPNIPAIRAVPDGRRRKIKLRWAEWGDKPGETFATILREIEKNPFLQGDNDRGWACNFDFVIENSTNWLKIVEGTYGSNGKKGGVADWNLPADKRMK